MKLLILTQKVDSDDTDLGFFHAWIKRLAEKTEKLTVICLFAGKYDLPGNVQVYSLGKEKGAGRLRYLINFYKYIWKLQDDYDGVFVHMNPEYCILGGIFWRLWHKKILFWYTHKAVNWRLRLAEKLVTKIFTASKESFRLPSDKVEVVGHGIDTDFFTPILTVAPTSELSILTAGRISLSKDLKTMVMVMDELEKNGQAAHLDIVGRPILPADKIYQDELTRMIKGFSLIGKINFLGARGYYDMPDIYRSHRVFLHCSDTGSLDKTVLEALSSGLKVVTTSFAFADWQSVLSYLPVKGYKQIADAVLEAGSGDKYAKGRELVRQRHNLSAVIQKIINFF